MHLTGNAAGSARTSSSRNRKRGRIGLTSSTCFNLSASFLGVLFIAAGVFGYRSVDQIREDAKTSVTLALQKAQNEVVTAVDGMKSEARKELDATRSEVRNRIDQEFRTDQITTLVRTVAKERTESELQGVIRLETSGQVAKAIRDQAPSIHKTVEERDQTGGAGSSAKHKLDCQS